MIKKLDLTSEAAAMQVLDVQIPSYRVEAELIGFNGIPYLSDTVESLMQAEEEFYGYLVDGQLAGMVALSMEEDVLRISRLVIAPPFFRQGIGRKLVQFVLDQNALIETIAVSTGASNLPAVCLYQKLGFVDTGVMEVAPDIFIALFERKKESAYQYLENVLVNP
ncbi:GNAT family N-acetyltransferase [Paenibacillus solisilvae]|uniref:GNAT family N-acetyltransferase n=1 Tax=Paenibacillus solisilvae TaxID=2486751 RepID=A0ABW0W5E4_9BACL